MIKLRDGSLLDPQTGIAYHAGELTMTRVTLNHQHLTDFAPSWPGAGAILWDMDFITFEFDASGNLVDIEPSDRNIVDWIEKNDPSMMSALSEDAESLIGATQIEELAFIILGPSQSYKDDVIEIQAGLDADYAQDGLLIRSATEEEEIDNDDLFWSDSPNGPQMLDDGEDWVRHMRKLAMSR